MGHCGGGPGPSSIGAAGQGVFPPTDMMQSSKFDSKHDMVLALIEWTENGRAPDHMIAAKFKNDQRAQGLQFQRKLCPWPLVGLHSFTRTQEFLLMQLEISFCRFQNMMDAVIRTLIIASSVKNSKNRR